MTDNNAKLSTKMVPLSKKNNKKSAAVKINNKKNNKTKSRQARMRFN